MTEKFTFTDGQYFCNICDEPHESEELAIDCFEACLDDARLTSVSMSDDALYYHPSEFDLKENVDELESINYDSSFWKGAGWYQLNFVKKTVVYLGDRSIGDYRAARTDLCIKCRWKEHEACSLEHPTCPCCHDTAEQLAHK